MARPGSVRVCARIVLAWFTLVIAFATASPWLQPHGMHSGCPVAAEALALEASGEEAAPSAQHGLACPLCLPWLNVPPLAWGEPMAAADLPTVQPRAGTRQPLPVAATLRPPARAPPARA
jgi:hypothetical protein